jgi:hypothetical protein
MAKTYKITEKDFILAVRKADREREIELHGKQISTRPARTHKSKKAYNRAKEKNVDKDLD